MSESSANEPQGYGRHDPAGRAVPADDSPVPAGPATVALGARPWQGPDRLVLRFPVGCSAIPLLIIPGLIAASVLRLDRLFWGGWGGGWGPVHPMAYGVVLVPVALMAWFWCRQTLLPRITFDQEAGLLTLGWRGLRGRRPLSSIIGVQVMQTRKRFGGPELNITAVTMYQLNLILDDPGERRLNVMTCDPLTARSNARRIADFLGVPVLDNTGTPAGAAGAGAAEPMPIPLDISTIPSPVVTELGPDVLLIRPRRLAFLLGVRWAGLMWLGVLVCLLANQVSSGYIVAAVGASLFFSLLGLLPTLGRRARFDRARGVLTLGWLVRRAPRPLASVQAVEVVEGPDYQLNLLPEDPRQPRLNLITDAEAALVRRAAEQVASFLAVPLLVARQLTPAAGQPGTGEAVNYLEELNRSPLPLGRASIRGPARVVPKGDDALVLRPRLRRSWARLLPALLTTGLGLYMVWLEWLGPAAGQAGLGQSAGWLMIVLLGPLSQVTTLKLLLLYRDHFDRQSGLLTLGWFGLKGTYPLAKVLAVQLVPGGLIDKAAGPFGRGGERVSFQLNLVMADAYQDRLNLTDDSDLEWTRQAGQQVADFLGVPLIDQIAEDD
jgi:hypothetical protein